MYFSNWFCPKVKEIFNTQLISLCNCLRDAFFWLLPNDWLTSRTIRPGLLKLMGMKIGGKCTIARAVYYGNIRNISLGSHTFINGGGMFHAGGKINIGQRVTIGFRVSMVTSTHEIGPPENRCGKLIRKDIIIEDGVWIASNVFIGPGVTIGAGSVVAAGAVVIHDMPSNCLIGGVPAKVIKELDH